MTLLLSVEMFYFTLFKSSARRTFMWSEWIQTLFADKLEHSFICKTLVTNKKNTHTITTFTELRLFWMCQMKLLCNLSDDHHPAPTFTPPELPKRVHVRGVTAGKHFEQFIHLKSQQKKNHKTNNHHVSFWPSFECPLFHYWIKFPFLSLNMCPFLFFLLLLNTNRTVCIPEPFVRDLFYYYYGLNEVFLFTQWFRSKHVVSIIALFSFYIFFTFIHV